MNTRSGSTPPLEGAAPPPPPLVADATTPTKLVSWPTPAEASMQRPRAAKNPVAGLASPRGGIKAPKNGALLIKSPSQEGCADAAPSFGIYTPSTMATPSGSKTQQEPRSVLSADRRRKANAAAEARLAEAAAFMDSVLNLSDETYDRLAGLSADGFMDAVVDGGVLLCRLVNKVSGTMRVAAKTRCSLGASAQARQNALHFAAASTELGVHADNCLNFSDLCDRRIKPVRSARFACVCEWHCPDGSLVSRGMQKRNRNSGRASRGTCVPDGWCLIRWLC